MVLRKGVSSETLFFVRVDYKFCYGMIMKEEYNMITFTILLISLLMLAVMSAIILLVGGAGFIAVFGDLIVCVLIIGLIVRLIKRRR